MLPRQHGATLDRLFTREVTLAPGQSDDFTLSVRLVGSTGQIVQNGRYYIGMRIVSAGRDPVGNNEVVSRSPLNILAPGSGSENDLADYRAVSIDSPESLQAGENLVSISYSIRNDGPGNGGRFIPSRVEFVGVSNGVTRTWTNGTLPELGSGRTFSASPADRVPSDLPTGDYDVRLVVDPENSHREGNESNNRLFRRTVVETWPTQRMLWRSTRPEES